MDHIPTPESIARRLKDSGLSDKAVSAASEARGKKLSPRTVFNVRNRRGGCHVSTIRAIAEVLAATDNHHRIDEEANQSVENVNKSAA